MAQSCAQCRERASPLPCNPSPHNEHTPFVEARVPEERTNVATGEARSGATSATRGRKGAPIPAPAGADESSMQKCATFQKAHANSDVSFAPSGARFRNTISSTGCAADASASSAPPVATFARPAGAKDRAIHFPHMTRWLVRISTCLILGAITTVATAWLIAWRADEQAGVLSGHDVQESAHVNLSIERSVGFGRLTVRAWRSPASDDSSQMRFSPMREEWRMLPEWSGLRESTGAIERGESQSDIRWVEANGWPFLALWYSGSAELDPSYRGISYFLFSIDGGIEAQLSDHPNSIRRALPCMPLWRGFLMNTVLFGMIWYVLLFAWLDVRCLRRRRSGRCTRCGYDLRSDFARGCPECGWNRGS